MFVNTHCHTQCSLLDAISKPKQIAKRCASLGMPACAMTDHGNISSAISFIKECKKYGVKPIIGCEFYITEDSANIKSKNNKVSHQVILAKNINGWFKLVKLVSQSNRSENFYYKPRIDIGMLKDVNVNGDLISFSGHPGSTLDNLENKEAYVELMKEIFGTENFFIEIQRIYGNDLPFCLSVSERMRELAIKTQTKVVATGDSHYVNKTDKILQNIMLCSSLKTTLNEVNNKIKRGDNVGLEGFFTTDKLHIPSYEEILECGNTEEEIANTLLIADMCEEYDLSSKPKLPKFESENGLQEDEYLTEICYKQLNERRLNSPNYLERLNFELNILKGAGLAGYFLIVRDYVNWCKSKNYLVGPARGSAAGSLVSYLANITEIDPLRYNLLFSRFYNEGRNTKDNISYPDIDIDFPTNKREEVIKYIEDKYGSDNVAQIATFGRMQGKGALKEVLRICNVCDFETMNIITKNIPQEHEINDLLEEAQEESILRWTLQNEPDILKEYCTIDDNYQLHGELARYFEYAIKLEGTYKSQGKHAAGVVISSVRLQDFCPMILDKNSNKPIIAFDMRDAEKAGFLKFDILGVNALDKLEDVNKLLKFGRI